MTWRPTVPARRRAWGLAGLVLGLVLVVGGCEAGGGGDGSATGPSAERSGTLPAPDDTASPDDTTSATTRPPRTTATPPTSVEPPTSIEPTTTDEPPTSREPTTRAPTTIEPPTTNEPPTSAAALPTTSAPSDAEPVSDESGGLGTVGWVLLAVLVVGLIAAVLIWRSRRSSAWDAEAAALERDTRAATGTRLPPVLTAETAGQRALSWPPVRAELLALVGRWDQLAERASDDRRRTRAGQVSSLLQELVAAVDAENEALASGRDWRLLRPRVDEAGRALTALLAGVTGQQPPAGGEPGPPPPGQW
jgi:hypothetical protein